MKYRTLIIFIIWIIFIQTAVSFAASEKELREYANLAEQTYLDNSMDVEVKAIGFESKTLEFKWVFMSRVVIHHFTKNKSVLRDLRSKGFQTIVFTDGYNQRWTWNIK